MMARRNILIIALAMVGSLLSVSVVQSSELDAKFATSLSYLSNQLDLFADRFTPLLAWLEAHSTDIKESEDLARRSYDGTKQRAEELKTGEVRSKVQGIVKHTAVIVVDVQYDFLQQAFPGSGQKGALGVDDTDQKYIDGVKLFVEWARNAGCLIVFTQDFHPKGHVSFLSRWLEQGNVVIQYKQPITKKGPYILSPYSNKEQKLWPDHCVQGTIGATIAIPFQVNEDLKVQKGMHLNFDSYSGFADDGGEKTGLETALDILGIKNLIIIGIASDICVNATVEDAIKLKKYNIYVITNLCRGVDVAASMTAFERMQKQGVRLLSLTTGPRDGITEALKYKNNKQKGLIDDLRSDQILKNLEQTYQAEQRAVEGELSN